jgi:hypothetical protein
MRFIVNAIILTFNAFQQSLVQMAKLMEGGHRKLAATADR